MKNNRIKVPARMRRSQKRALFKIIAGYLALLLIFLAGYASYKVILHIDRKELQRYMDQYVMQGQEYIYDYTKNVTWEYRFFRLVYGGDDNDIFQEDHFVDYTLKQMARQRRMKVVSPMPFFYKPGEQEKGFCYMDISKAGKNSYTISEIKAIGIGYAHIYQTDSEYKNPGILYNEAIDAITRLHMFARLQTGALERIKTVIPPETWIPNQYDQYYITSKFHTIDRDYRYSLVDGITISGKSEPDYLSFNGNDVYYQKKEWYISIQEKPNNLMKIVMSITIIIYLLSLGFYTKWCSPLFKKIKA